MQQDEYSLLNSKLLQFWAAYRTGRAAGIRREMTLENYLSAPTPFFVRLADRENAELDVWVPPIFDDYDLSQLPLVDMMETESYALIKTAPPTGVSCTYRFGFSTEISCK